MRALEIPVTYKNLYVGLITNLKKNCFKEFDIFYEILVHTHIHINTHSSHFNE